jgi:DNA helicase-2/ATP-dependent DNA helicase PcrA
MQDLAGFDWELIELLLRSPIGITLVGDTRQGTFSTNLAAKNKQFRGHRASTLVEQWKAKGLCTVLQRLVSYRCPQSICTLADSLYPAMPATTSMNDHISGHDGLYIVAPAHFEAYMAEFNPTILRYDRRTLTDGLPAFNFGEVKGLTFPRVLIAANGPIQTFLRSGNPTSIKSPAKYYVAFTRAKHSLAFLYGGKCALPGIQTYLPTEPGA